MNPFLRVSIKNWQVTKFCTTIDDPEPRPAFGRGFLLLSQGQTPFHTSTIRIQWKKRVFLEPRQELAMQDWRELPVVTRDKATVSGVWLFRGTRVPVAALFENLREGASIEEFLEWFPGVERSQVKAVLDCEVSMIN